MSSQRVTGQETVVASAVSDLPCPPTAARRQPDVMTATTTHTCGRCGQRATVLGDRAPHGWRKKSGLWVCDGCGSSRGRLGVVEDPNAPTARRQAIFDIGTGRI